MIGPILQIAKRAHDQARDLIAGAVTGLRAPALDREERLHKRRYFSCDFFSSNLPIWEPLLESYRGKPGAQYLEIGVLEGRSLFWMLENIFTHPTSGATAIDPLGPLYAYKLIWNLAHSPSASRLKLVARKSSEVLPGLPAKSFDVIYVDGSHLAKDVGRDLELSWPLLKTGGILIADDYLWKAGEREDERRPGPAIDAFLECTRNELEILEKGYQVIVRKLRVQ